MIIEEIIREASAKERFTKRRLNTDDIKQTDRKCPRCQKDFLFSNSDDDIVCIKCEYVDKSKKPGIHQQYKSRPPGMDLNSSIARQIKKDGMRG